MITGLYAGLSGLLLVALYLRVSQRRLAMKIGAGTGGDAELEQRIRAHANFVENAPIVLILLFLTEQSGMASIYVHAFGAAFVIARLAHAQGISSTMGRSNGRFFGSIGSLLVTLGLSMVLIIRALG